MSEKIFLALLAGATPLVKGCVEIRDIVPRYCFIDLIDDEMLRMPDYFHSRYNRMENQQRLRETITAEGVLPPVP